ncbi:MAG: hypothetical protein QF437_00135 [Planctomycetota bacterium]|nr:hypothetical protein [Planctomycetota bacterium]MDP7247990.1 hypothetical protein [Planctomycetota bacterium]
MRGHIREEVYSAVDGFPRPRAGRGRTHDIADLRACRLVVFIEQDQRGGVVQLVGIKAGGDGYRFGAAFEAVRFSDEEEGGGDGEW